jgi:N-acetylmuramic acid 6-phosphate etherase
MLETEKRNPKTTHIDSLDTLSMVKLINEENYNSVKAVEAALPKVAEAIDIISDAMAKGGRLIYIGAGTSGRLAVMDAAECPPTFGVDHNTVVAIIAGGEQAMVRAQENVEDSADSGKKDVVAIDICEKDVLVGISAAGGAAYVVSALQYAKELGCKTISLSSNDKCKIAEVSDVHIFVNTGAEVITGSTRMKAGNAQKMVLNMLSTCAMIRGGKVYENLMINLKPTNIKLKERMIGIVCDICNTDRDNAIKLLEENDFSIRKIVDNMEK